MKKLSRNNEFFTPRRGLGKPKPYPQLIPSLGLIFYFAKKAKWYKISIKWDEVV